MGKAQKINILYEDNHIIAVNKPCGVLVQGDKTGDEALDSMVKSYIKSAYDKPGDVFLGVVHRIDRPVSGVVIFARTSKALKRLNKAFQDREIRKVYWAAVIERLPVENDRLVHYLRKNQEKNMSRAFDHEAKHTKYCELTYKTLAASESYTLVEVYPKTGRHHQIRVQLAKIGCPIKGDLKYGAKRSNPDAGIHLHARKLEFEHPVKKGPMKIVAPLPKDTLWQVFEKMV